MNKQKKSQPLLECAWLKNVICILIGGMNIRSYTLPFVVVLWVCVFVWLVALTFDFHRDYSQRLSHRIDQQQPAKLRFEHNCQDANRIVNMNMASFCHDLSHTLEETPSTYALYEVLSNRGLCFGYSCERFFEQLGFGKSPLQAILIAFVIVWLVMFGCGIKMTTFGMERYNQQYLPHTMDFAGMNAVAMASQKPLMNIGSFASPPAYQQHARQD